MADDRGGSPPPNPDAAPASHGRSTNSPSAVQSQTSKRNPRHRKNNSQSIPQMDGTVSDSVTNPISSPRAKKGPKQRQQSAAVGSLPNETGNMGKSNVHKPRHASVGGSMLPATPFKEQAYAGPTFQASPAPSSLPVPKFFSKSVPNVAAPPSLEARMAGEKTPENEQSSPEPSHVSPPSAAPQSPLDLFFKADRAEKEKSRTGSMLSPEMAARQPPPATEPRNPFQQPGKSTFLRELDGDSEDLPSPKTVPQNKRPSLAQRASSSPGIRAGDADSESEREAYTKSLKDLLFNNVNNTPPQNPSHTQQRTYSNTRGGENVFETPSPFQRSTSGPSTPKPSVEQQNHYSLAYGNRNLSPLFKAARSETPPRPSGLRRQEIASDVVSDTDSAITMPPERQQLPQIDPNSFSRNYLDQQIRSSQPASLPQLPHTNGTNSTSNTTSGSSSQQGVPLGASPRTGGNSRDVKTMEDDLRRMLKLDVLSS